ncbi:seipin [Agrilus planipennis]|uniref:Seipin n=1 Tax=Agrilus planipennis TaxID=224129 RepID=A0A1W4XS61_AGRPL|nr:seipin [Agrilus planipennis]
MLQIYTNLKTFFELGPKEYYRQKFKLPLVKFVYEIVNSYKKRTKQGFSNLRDVLFRGTVVALSTSVLVWLSILMYLAFYYAYVPKVSHEKPVHLQFKPCEDKGICSFPSAHVELTKRQQLLMLGQLYRIHLELELPESPANKELGMFMVCADFRERNGLLVASTCRSTMMHYRSNFIDFLYKAVFSPLYIFGGAEEKQNIQVELFSDYEEHENQPVTDIYVEIQTKHIEMYSAKFCIHANFSGLRYVMFHFPILSAAIGITSNLFFIAVVCMISWYQLINSEEYMKYMDERDSNEDQNQLEYFKGDLEDSSSSSFEEPDVFNGNESENNFLEERATVENINE